MTFRYNSTYNNTNLEHIRQLNEALKSNPALITNTTDEAFAYIQQGGYIYPSQEDTYEMYISQSMCDLYRFSAGRYIIWFKNRRSKDIKVCTRPKSEMDSRKESKMEPGPWRPVPGGGAWEKTASSSLKIARC